MTEWFLLMVVPRFPTEYKQRGGEMPHLYVIMPLTAFSLVAMCVVGGLLALRHRNKTKERRKGRRKKEDPFMEV
jgi:type II secretory pathway component PulF